MAGQTLIGLPPASTPLALTDYMIVSRDGVTLTQTTIAQVVAPHEAKSDPHPQYTTAARAAAAAPVQTVNGKSGGVVLSTTDIAEGTNLYFTTARAAAAAPVQSVAGRTGAIVLSAPDIAGLAASATTDTTNAANISSGILSSARGGAGTVTGLLKANGLGVVSAAFAGTDYLAPNGNGSQLTGITTSQVSEGSNLYFTNARASAAAPVQSVAGRTGGVVLTAADIGGLAPSATVDATNATNITSGILSSNRGGAGSNNGLLKANGSGVVSTAVAGVDYMRQVVDEFTGAGPTFALTAVPIDTFGSGKVKTYGDGFLMKKADWASFTGTTVTVPAAVLNNYTVYQFEYFR